MATARSGGYGDEAGAGASMGEQTYGGRGGGIGRGMTVGRRGRYPIETKPFFLTSEFFALVLSLLALWIYTAADDAIDADLAWPLTVALVSFYMLSRGLAKTGTRHFGDDPREGDRGR